MSVVANLRAHRLALRFGGCQLRCGPDPGDDQGDDQGNDQGDGNLNWCAPRVADAASVSGWVSRQGCRSHGSGRCCGALNCSCQVLTLRLIPSSPQAAALCRVIDSGRQHLRKGMTERRGAVATEAVPQHVAMPCQAAQGFSMTLHGGSAICSSRSGKRVLTTASRISSRPRFCRE